MQHLAYTTYMQGVVEDESAEWGVRLDHDLDDLEHQPEHWYNNIIVSIFWIISIVMGYVVVFHYSFNLHFANDFFYVDQFFMGFLTIQIFFEFSG